MTHETVTKNKVLNAVGRQQWTTNEKIKKIYSVNAHEKWEIVVNAHNGLEKEMDEVMYDMT